jgi:hypothetical protein
MDASSGMAGGPEIDRVFLPFAQLMLLLALAALIAGLGYRKLGQALAISTAVSPPTGLVAGVAALLLVLRLTYHSPLPGRSVLGVLVDGLISASVVTLLTSIGLVAWQVQGRRELYLQSTERSWGLLSLALVVGAAAVMMAMAA